MQKAAPQNEQRACFCAAVYLAVYHTPLHHSMRYLALPAMKQDVQASKERLTHDAKSIHIAWLGQATVSESLWSRVHDGPHMIASRHIFFGLMQGSAQAYAQASH